MAPAVHSMAVNTTIFLSPDSEPGDKALVEFEAVLNAISPSYEYDPVSRLVRRGYNTHTFRFGGPVEALDMLIEKFTAARAVLVDACKTCSDDVADEMARVSLMWGSPQGQEGEEV